MSGRSGHFRVADSPQVGNISFPPQQVSDTALRLWIEAAYLDAYAAWLSLLPNEKQMYPMPKKPAVE